MTATMMLATGCMIWGLIAGAVLTLTYTAAAVSRSQERMQRKVTQARAEAHRYRAQCQQPDVGAQSQWEFW